MPLSKDISTYEDLRPYLDRALSSQSGIAIEAQTPGMATHLRHRLYAFRVLDRKLSLELYEIDDPRRGRSIYDALAFSTRGASVEIRPTAPLAVVDL